MRGGAGAGVRAAWVVGRRDMYEHGKERTGVVCCVPVEISPDTGSVRGRLCGASSTEEKGRSQATDIALTQFFDCHPPHHP